MTMTRQHFEMIADIIRTSGLRDSEIRHLAVIFANRLAQTNERFDKERFIKAATEGK